MEYVESKTHEVKGEEEGAEEEGEWWRSFRDLEIRWWQSIFSFDPRFREVRRRLQVQGLRVPDMYLYGELFFMIKGIKPACLTNFEGDNAMECYVKEVLHSSGFFVRYPLVKVLQLPKRCHTTSDTDLSSHHLFYLTSSPISREIERVFGSSSPLHPSPTTSSLSAHPSPTLSSSSSSDPKALLTPQTEVIISEKTMGRLLGYPWSLPDTPEEFPGNETLVEVGYIDCHPNGEEHSTVKGRRRGSLVMSYGIVRSELEKAKEHFRNCAGIARHVFQLVTAVNIVE